MQNREEQIISEWYEMFREKSKEDRSDFRRFLEFWLERKQLDYNEAMTLWKIKN